MNETEKLALNHWKGLDDEINHDLDEIEKNIDVINAGLDSFHEKMLKNEILVEYISEEMYNLSNSL